jgi:hypothetical protein
MKEIRERESRVIRRSWVIDYLPICIQAPLYDCYLLVDLTWSNPSTIYLYTSLALAHTEENHSQILSKAQNNSGPVKVSLIRIYGRCLLATSPISPHPSSDRRQGVSTLQC